MHTNLKLSSKGLYCFERRFIATKGPLATLFESVHEAVKQNWGTVLGRKPWYFYSLNAGPRPKRPAFITGC